MPNVPFGSPSAGDATAYWEERIKKGAEIYLAAIQRGVEILNRPIGSRTDLSDEEKIQDWQMLTSDVNQLITQRDQRAQVVGPDKANLELLQWDAAMKKLEGKQ